MKLGLVLLCALAGSSALAEQRCGDRPAGADWFYLGDAPPRYALAAAHVLSALRVGLDASMLSHEPACLHVTVIGDLHGRSHALGSGARRRELPPGTLGFHLDQLGADDTVFVNPSPSVPIEVVMLHESLHVLSHRFSREASRRGIPLFNEAVTDYITRELAVLALGYRREAMHSGYDDGVRVVRALVARLGDDALLLLADTYLRDGYEALEKTVDRRLGIRLGEVGRDVQQHDTAGALAALRPASR